MYLPSCTYPSKSDFGSITSPFLAENGSARLDQSTAAARGLSEYRGHCCPPPWKWTRPITSPSWEAVYHEYHGLPPQSETIFSPSKDSFPRFHTQAFGEDARRYAAFNPESQLLFPAGRDRVLPPAFDQFSAYTDEEMDLKTQTTTGTAQHKEANRAELTSCHSGERSEVRAGSETTPAGKEDEEDALLSSGCGGEYSHAQSKWTLYNSVITCYYFKLVNEAKLFNS